MKNGNVIKLVKCIIGGVIVIVALILCCLFKDMAVVLMAPVTLILGWMFYVVEKPHKEGNNDNKPIS